MEIEGIVLGASITMLSLGLLIISVVSYRKHKNPKLLFISLVFIVLFIKGMLLSLGLFFPELTLINSFIYSTYSGLFDLIILIFLFIATFKR